jgi:hypothetical protein
MFHDKPLVCILIKNEVIQFLYLLFSFLILSILLLTIFTQYLKLSLHALVFGLV